MTFYKHSRLILITLAMFTISSLVAMAKLEQKMLSVNKKDKKVTFTFYHFDSTSTVTLTEVTEDLGDTASKKNNKAGVSASEITNFSFDLGKFSFPPATTYLIKNGIIDSPVASPARSKHAFILTDDKHRHAICYAPSTSEAELGYALEQYLSDSSIKFKNAVIIHSGNQCGFYKNNGKYNPYYLKELKKPAKALLVK